MSIRGVCFALALFGWSVSVALAGDGLSHIWRDPNATVQQRAAAVNRAFTNGTPMSVVVAALGTNYVCCFSSTSPPPSTYWLSYRFGQNEVWINTSAVFGQDIDPLTKRFTGAGFATRVETNNHF